ncbi:MAG: RNA polymerase sigma factor RpoS [Bacteroides rodentium]
MAAGTTQSTNEELVERLRAAGENTPEAARIMGELWERNIKLVRQAVHTLTGLDYGKPGFEDMEQQAYFGFHAAAYTYNPATGYKFSTHAVNCVRWELSRYYERNGAAVRIPSAMKQRIRLCVNKRRQIEAETGHAVTNEEALKALGLSHHTIVVTLSAMKKLETASLDAATYSNGDGDALSLLDKLADGADVAETVLEQEWPIELRKTLLKALQDIPADTRTIIVRHYFSHVKIRAMAKDRGITPQTLYNRINSAFQSIRTGHYGTRLAEFMPTNSSYNRAQRLIKQEKEALERLQLTEAERGLLAL